MHVAAWEGRVEVIAALVPVVPSPARTTSGPGWTSWEGEGGEQTPLLIAAYQGHAAAVQLLLRHAFCTDEPLGRLSCGAIREPAAKRAMARVLAAAEEAGSTGAVDILRKSGAKPMTPNELAGSASADAGLQSGGSGAGGGAEKGASGASASLSPFAQLLQSTAEYRDFSVDLRAQYATIGALMGYKRASQYAPHVHYRSARLSPAAQPEARESSSTTTIVGERQASMLFRPALQAAAATHRASLRTKGYAVVGPVYEPAVLSTLLEHYQGLISSGALSFSDPQSKRYVARNEKVSRLIHEDLMTLISLIVGRRVKPTYTYFSGYVEGSVLPLHTDRADCEYTVSFLLERAPRGLAWPIYLERSVTPGLAPGPKRHMVSKAACMDSTTDACIQLDCDENAFMIFKGRHHAHFREALVGNHSYTLLLHYVHDPDEQALMQNGDEGSSRGTDVAAAAAALSAGERIIRVDGGELPSKAATFRAYEANDTSLQYVHVPATEHFFYPPRYVGHKQPLDPGLVPPPPDQQRTRSLALETLSVSPRVFRVDNFLSADECRAIMRAATPALRPSILQSMGHPQQVEGGKIDPIRTSETAWLDRFFGVNRGAPETDVTRRVLLRAVAMARVPGDTHAEGLQVLRYSVGGKYRHHVDWTEGIHPARLATVLIFLNDDTSSSDEFGRIEGGGATHFALKHSLDDHEMVKAGCTSATGTAVTPRAGTAIFFYNVHPQNSATKDYALDWSAWHSGCNVTGGSKWVANVWIRNDVTKW